MKNKHSLLAWVLIGVIIIVVGNVFFLKKQNDELQRIAVTVEEAKTRYDGEIQVLSTLLTNMQTAHQNQIEKLTDIIEETQQASEEKISELQQEVKGISIEAGDFSEIAEEALLGVVSIITDKTQGSGAIVTSDGVIVTNEHVIEQANKIVVLMYDKSLYEARILGVEKINDVAVLKINASGLHDLDFANSDKVKIGEKVIALGNPAGLGFSVTEGIVSQKDRIIDARGVGLIQTDVPINPGNSGGPVVNTNGDLIGIARLKIKGFESLGFAIPSNFIALVLKELGIDTST